MNSVKIASLNCRGLYCNKKRIDVLNFLKEKDYHIYCLQDTHWPKELEKAVYSEWDGQVFVSYGKSNARGCAILIKKNIDIKVNQVKTDDNGNLLAINISIGEIKITLIKRNTASETIDDDKVHSLK